CRGDADADEQGPVFPCAKGFGAIMLDRVGAVAEEGDLAGDPVKGAGLMQPYRQGRARQVEPAVAYLGRELRELFEESVNEWPRSS
ncbi:MAG: hypothetical protein ACOYLF_09940, partial [Blastocatellia bacterium]